MINEDHAVVALVCCRGGSKTYPGKNIKEFAGKPMLAWILEAAVASDVFDDIVLSTDSPEIATVGERYGAIIPGLRPAYLAAETSDQFDTHCYIFDKLGVSDDTHRICVLNNNPFISADLIREGYNEAVRVQFEHLVLDSVPVAGDYAFFRQCNKCDGVLKPVFPDAFAESKINRQDTEPTYVPISNIRWGKPSMLRSYDAFKHAAIDDGVVPIWLSKTRNFDIDDEEDWIIAEAVFEILNRACPHGP